MTTEPALRVRDLGVEYRARRGKSVTIGAREVSFDVPVGATVGLVGESGSGKSTVGRAVMGLVPPTTGTVSVTGRQLAASAADRTRAERGLVQMVFQDPVTSLNPSLTVLELIGEPVRLHSELRGDARRDRVAALLRQVEMQPEQMERYPHEFSGGQRQRIAIARALATDPRVVVLDEAVSALDVSTQRRIIDMLGRIQAETGIAYLFISHDLTVVSKVCDEVMVMYRGDVVEHGSGPVICAEPTHPYTALLVASVPTIDLGQRAEHARRRRALDVVGGVIADDITGCAFEPRCPFSVDECRTRAPRLTPAQRPGSGRACHVAERELLTQLDDRTGRR